MNRLTKLCAIPVLLLLMGVAVYGSESLPAKTGAPVALLEERSFTFTPVPEGTEVVHDFTIKNKGSAPLQIEQVKTG